MSDDFGKVAVLLGGPSSEREISFLSGNAVLAALREQGAGDVPVVCGGIIPDADVEPLKAAGVAAVYTPKDFDLTKIMRDVVELVEARHGVAAEA